jgi:hypothetical protein
MLSSAADYGKLSTTTARSRPEAGAVIHKGAGKAGGDGDSSPRRNENIDAKGA